MQTPYTATALSTGDGRSGHVRTDDGLVDVDLALPVELGGPGGSANPEQLFATGYAACFHGSLRLAAGQARVRTPDSTVAASVGIGPNDQGGFALNVTLEVTLPGAEQHVAEQLARRAHAICPYSNATRGNVPVQIIVHSTQAVSA